MIHWASAMGSEWNIQAINGMARIFLHLISIGAYPDILRDALSLSDAESYLSDRFTEHRKNHLVRSGETSEDLRRRQDADKQQARRRQRRNKVRNVRYLKGVQDTYLLPQLYKRRHSTVEKELESATSEDAEPWVGAMGVVTQLDALGMSSDESEDEGSGVVRYRRVAKPWLSSEVTNLMHHIDNKYSQHGPNGKRKPGAPRINRCIETIKESGRAPLRGLPSNFYDDLYLSSLTPMARTRLRMSSPMAIPDFMVSRARFQEVPVVTVIKAAVRR